MNIDYKFTRTEANEQLKQLTEQKLETLSKYIGDKPAHCVVEFDKEVSDQQSGDVFRVEANLTVDGTLYRGEETMQSFEHALDEVRAEIDKALRRAGKKRDTLIRRGGRKLKDMMRFGR